MINHLRWAWFIYLGFTLYTVVITVLMPHSGYAACFAVAVGIFMGTAVLSAVVEGILRAVRGS